MSAAGTLRRSAVLAAALAVPSLMVAAQLYAGYRLAGFPIHFAGALLIQLSFWETWTIAGPVVWSLEQRWPLVAAPERSRGGRRRDALIRHGLTAVAVACIVLALTLAAYHLIVRIPMLAGWFVGLDRSIRNTAVLYGVSYFHVELVIYAAIVAAAHAVRTTRLLGERERDALRLESELTGARLTALRAQLQPHFLFNTLHTIGSLVLQRDNDRAVQLIAELGELLRATLSHRDTDLAPLRDELAYLRRYLRIEEARFADRLRLEWSVEPASEDALIPPFLLQPVVENAFRHGIARRTDPSLLRIAAATADGVLRITVYNDGPPLAEAFSLDATPGGYGLRNVVERLRTRQPAGRLELANAGTGVCATLVLPRWNAGAGRIG
jgi:histidine kinase